MLYPEADDKVVFQNQLLATFYFEPSCVPPMSPETLPLEERGRSMQLEEHDEAKSWRATLDELRVLIDVVGVRVARLDGHGRAGLRIAHPD